MIDSSVKQKLDLFFRQYKTLSYKRRAMILNSHDAISTTNVFYIKSGYIRVYRISEDGEELTLTILKPGDFFPLTYGFHSSQQHYYLEAITQLELWKAPQEQFLQFIRKDADIFYELTNRVFVRFDGFLTRFEYLVFSNAYIKVSTTLLMCAKELGEENGDQIVVKVPLTHKDIATMVGITRETTSLEMKKLEKKGFLSRIGKNIVITNYKQFEIETLQGTPELIALPKFF